MADLGQPAASRTLPLELETGVGTVCSPQCLGLQCCGLDLSGDEEWQ